MTTDHRVRSVLVVVATSAALILPMLVVSASPASATSYRYWSFWLQSGSNGSRSCNTSWCFAQEGAGTIVPRDGDVQGWRFAISSGATSSDRPPRATTSFATICSGVAASTTTKRVAVVVDFGTPSDAPTNESPPALLTTCEVVSSTTTALSVLYAAVSVRQRSGFVCGINGYPRTECGTVVASPTQPVATSSPAQQSSTAGSAATASGAGAVTAGQAAASSPLPSVTTTAASPSGTLAPGSASPTSMANSKDTSNSAAARAEPTGSSGPRSRALTIGVIALILILAAGVALQAWRRSMEHQ